MFFSQYFSLPLSFLFHNGATIICLLPMLYVLSNFLFR
jgi:hypothetical protein